MADPTDRQARGQRGEDLVASFLEDRDFTVLARNLRMGHLEIDLVARRDDLVVMVEVRARGTGALERPLTSIASKKRMYLLNAADRLWRTKLSKMGADVRLRIDVAAVDLRYEPPHIEYIEGALMR